jgi:L-aspartate semialdehyde sulfurtransferase
MAKTIEEINEKIKAGTAVVMTAEEIIGMVRQNGVRETARKVDVVTTGTFSPMCSSGAFLNFGHSTPAIRMGKVWLNDVPAYAGIAAVDAYIGATEPSESLGIQYGGAHVIEDLIAGREVELRAESHGTDCYPRKKIRTLIHRDRLNQAYMFNPRNAYQNYPAATNSTDRILHTYMGTLLPKFGNVTYATAGELSPLLNDPFYRTIGVGTRLFLGGAQGYVAWEGTQHNPSQARLPNGTPVNLSGTLAVIGDLKAMDSRYIRACVYEKYGVSLFVGIGIPIPLLDEDVVERTAVSNLDIFTEVVDKSGMEDLGLRVSYAQLRSGRIDIRGRQVAAAPLSSLLMAREIAGKLKDWIAGGTFLLTAPVAPLPVQAGPLNRLEIRGNFHEDN